MATVNETWQRFVSSLELSEREQSDAARQRDNLRGILERAFAIKEFLISGSFGRHTATRPLDDVDLFVVLSEAKHSDLREASPTRALTEIQKALDQAFPNKAHPIIQNRSVRIDFEGTGLSFDVVPAFPSRGDDYVIPDRDKGAWIVTNPRVHRELSTEANKRAGDKAKPLVKALKHWNRGLEKKAVRSFHLELMVYDSLPTPPTSYPEGAARLFRALESRVLSSFPNPVGVGAAVDEGMTPEERARASRSFADAASRAERAVSLAADGRTEEAHGLWRELLGEVYPEKGRKAGARNVSIGTGAGLGTAPDAPGRRFG